MSLYVLPSKGLYEYQILRTLLLSLVKVAISRKNLSPGLSPTAYSLDSLHKDFRSNLLFAEPSVKPTWVAFSGIGTSTTKYGY
jgi:hypothetical protein